MGASNTPSSATGLAAGFGKSVLAGGLASTISKTLVAPAERIRIVLQAQGIVSTGGSGVSAASSRPSPMRLADALRLIQREEGGVRAYWRGNLVNCLRSFPTSALRFSLFAQLSDWAGREVRESFSGALLLGAASGGVTAVMTFPMDLVRTKLAADTVTGEGTASGPSQRYRGPWHCVTDTVHRGGVAALYRGLYVSVLEIMPYTAISLGGYDLAKSHLPFLSGRGSDAPVLGKLAVGWAVGLCASLLCYPLDTLKRHVMLLEADAFPDEGPRLLRSAGAAVETAPATATAARATAATTVAATARATAPAAPRIRDTTPVMVRCALRIYRTHGVRGFYFGCLINAAKSAPAAGVTLVANDAMRVALGLEE
jgi:solute carrier family 25 (adenine nucleotide translocator) protein 4/5/6/31